MRLTALNEAAASIGLRRGQGLAEARAIYPSLAVFDEDKDADLRFLETIADWCDCYTPLVAFDKPDGLFLDITGCVHLFGGEKKLLEDILSRLLAMGIDTRAAISSSPGLSWAISRFGENGIIDNEHTADALAALPVAALRLAPDTIASLHKAGLKRVSDLMGMPRAPLTRRFGPHLLLRLDQALGLVEEPISPRRPVASLCAERRLAEPVQTYEDILQLAGQTARALKPALEARGEGGRLFELVLFRVDGHVFRIAAGTSRPLRDPARIAALFAERLATVHEDMDLGYGFEIVRLNVLQHEPYVEEQGDLENHEQPEAALATFVDRVAARLGHQTLHHFQLRESHWPERAVIAMPLLDVSKNRTKPAATSMENCFPAAERPLRLLRNPEPVEIFAAEVPEGPPARFRWRRATHRVLRAEGPERLAAEWWREEEHSSTRDYFRIEDEDGRRFWLFREGFYDGEASSPRWFMHGFFA